MRLRFARVSTLAFVAAAAVACRPEVVVNVDQTVHTPGVPVDTSKARVDTTIIRLGQGSITLWTNSACGATTATLQATTFPAGLPLTYSVVGGSGVVSVTPDGTVRVVGPGSAIVRVGIIGTNIHTDVPFTVSSCNTGVTSVTVAPSSITTGNGTGCQRDWSLVVNTIPINQPVTWTSSNPSVATVSSTGVVTVVGVGTTSITARAASGVSGSMTFTVTNTPCNSAPGATISFTPVGGSYPFGTIINLVTTCAGTFMGTSCTPWFYSSDPSRWLVDPRTGKVTNIFRGSATICVQWSQNLKDPRFCAVFTTPS